MQRSNQSLQSPRPPHQNFNFISASSPFSRIFLSVFHDEDTVPSQSLHIYRIFISISHQNTLQANYPPPCRCRTRSTGFPSASSSLDPFDTVALSRTHPTPSETPTHPNRLMKRFKKKAANQHHKNLNNTTPSPSFHRPNKKPLQTSKPMIKINDTADRPPPRYLSMKMYVIVSQPLKNPHHFLKEARYPSCK